jgi:hypothetical protein
LVSSWLSDGPTLPLTMASIHLVLKVSSWRVSVLIQTERQIDRWCPHSDHWIIWCYWLCFFCSAIHLAYLETGPSDHPTVTSSFACFCAMNQVHRRMHQWYHRFIFSRLQLGYLLQLNILNIPSLIAPKYIFTKYVVC